MKTFKNFLLLIFVSLSYNLFAQTEPPHPGDPGSGDTGVGVPLDAGLITILILLVAGLTYFAFVYYKKKIKEAKLKEAK